MRLAYRPSKRTIQLLVYLGIAACASMLVLGMLAAIFEHAVIVRVYGGLTAAAALVVGATAAWRTWHQGPAVAMDASVPPLL